jgi:hypothetical protein
MGKVDEDNNYLKTSLWPLLENFFTFDNVDQFWSFHPQSYLESLTEVPKVFENERHSDLLNSVDGEGTCEPHGSALEEPPHLPVHFMTDRVPCLCRRLREEGHSSKRCIGGEREA